MTCVGRGHMQNSVHVTLGALGDLSVFHSIWKAGVVQMLCCMIQLKSNSLGAFTLAVVAHFQPDLAGRRVVHTGKLL